MYKPNKMILLAFCFLKLELSILTVKSDDCLWMISKNVKAAESKT